MTFSVSPDDGTVSLSTTSATTDSNGRASTILRTGSGSSGVYTVTALVGTKSVSSTATVEAPLLSQQQQQQPPPENNQQQQQQQPPLENNQQQQQQQPPLENNQQQQATATGEQPATTTTTTGEQSATATAATTAAGANDTGERLRL